MLNFFEGEDKEKSLYLISMDAVSDTYLSIAAPARGLYKDRGSRFIALAWPVESEQQAKLLIESVRKDYYDARHCCPAYRIGKDGSLWRASDDGEPAGSAGRPILGQIDSAGLSDILVVVVRYFGGIKLGVPGLIKAYKEATADALRNAEIISKIAGNTWRLDFPYDSMPKVMKVVKDLELQPSSTDFGLECSLEVRVRLTLEDSFTERLSDPAIKMMRL